MECSFLFLYFFSKAFILPICMHRAMHINWLKQFVLEFLVGKYLSTYIFWGSFSI